jgi:hypothetical protein
MSIEKGKEEGRKDRGRGTDHEVGEGIGDDLSPPGSDSRISILERPTSTIDAETIEGGRSEDGMLKEPEEHREAICNGSSAEAEGIHETGGKNCGIACVTEAKHTF